VSALFAGKLPIDELAVRNLLTVLVEQRLVPVYAVPIPPHIAETLEHERVVTGGPSLSAGSSGFFTNLAPPVPTTSCGARGGLASPKLSASNM
jgi:hypothetical protein